MITTGGELRAWRLKHGIKQKALARVLGVTGRAVGLVEHEDRPLRVIWQWALEGVARHVENRDVPPAFVRGDRYGDASTRRTPQE